MKALLLLCAVGCRSDLVRSPQTLEVGGCDALAAALDDAHRLRFSAEGTLTLRVNGTHASDCTRPLVIAHPQGDHLYIEGPSDDPGAYVMVVRHGGPGLEVVSGGLGGLSGLTLERDLTTAGPESVGILARNGADVTLGRSLILRDFSTGVRLAFGATVRTAGAPGDDRSLLISGSSHYGVSASGGSDVSLTHACIAAEPSGDCSDPHADCRNREIAPTHKANGVAIDEASHGDLSSSVIRCANGAGISATRGSFLTVEDALITGSLEHGVVAHSGSHVRAGRTISEKNGLSGFSANNGATLHAREGRALDNGEYGFVGANMAVIDARQSEALRNGAGAFRGFLRTNIYAEEAGIRENGLGLPEHRRIDVMVSRGSSAWLASSDDVVLRLPQCPMTLTSAEQSFIYWVGRYIVVSRQEPRNSQGEPCVAPGTRGVAWVPSP